MFKKSMIVVCLCVMSWAGTAQAGFLGNNLELQFLQNLVGTPSVSPLSDGLNSNVGGTGIDVTVGSSTLGVTVPDTYSPQSVGLSINNIIPTITDATGSGNGNVSVVSNSVVINNLSPGRENVTLTVPEPGALDLVALGLVMLGMTVYLRRRAQA